MDAASSQASPNQPLLITIRDSVIFFLLAKRITLTKGSLAVRVTRAAETSEIGRDCERDVYAHY